jgi:hypothetical protein
MTDILNERGFVDYGQRMWRSYRAKLNTHRRKYGSAKSMDKGGHRASGHSSHRHRHSYHGVLRKMNRAARSIVMRRLFGKQHLRKPSTFQKAAMQRFLGGDAKVSAIAGVSAAWRQQNRGQRADKARLSRRSNKYGLDTLGGFGALASSYEENNKNIIQESTMDLSKLSHSELQRKAKELQDHVNRGGPGSKDAMKQRKAIVSHLKTRSSAPAAPKVKSEPEVTMSKPSISASERLDNLRSFSPTPKKYDHEAALNEFDTHLDRINNLIHSATKMDKSKRFAITNAIAKAIGHSDMMHRRVTNSPLSDHVHPDTFMLQRRNRMNDIAILHNKFLYHGKVGKSTLKHHWDLFSHHRDDIENIADKRGLSLNVQPKKVQPKDNSTPQNTRKNKLMGKLFKEDPIISQIKSVISEKAGRRRFKKGTPALKSGRAPEARPPKVKKSRNNIGGM